MAKVRIGLTYLDEHLVENDYYSEEKKVVGTWFGKGAERLGIAGNGILAADKSFERLRENLHPGTGEKLTPRTKDQREASFIEAQKSLLEKWRYEGIEGMPSASEIEAHRLTMPPVPNRVAFYDFQCGAPKSVSVLALVAGDERLRAAHTESVMVALGELERFAACRGKEAFGRLKRHEFTGEICAAVFEHDTSRSLDPQLHAHCVVANATWDKARERWAALTEYEIVQAIRYVGKVYQNDLARRVQALGYEITPEQDAKGVVTGWQIAGVSSDICKKYSKRRMEIEAAVEQFQKIHKRKPSSAEIGVITRNTRSRKMENSSPEKVRALQREQLSADELSGLEKIVRDATPRESANGKEKEALSVAVAHCFERVSVLKCHQLLAEALNVGMGAVELAKLKTALMRGAAETELLAPNAGNPLAGELATKDGIKTEMWSVGFVNRTNGKFAPLAADADVRLQGEQGEAVRFVCRSTNQVVAVRGVAGAGKTTMLKELSSQLAAQGREMVYLAPTSSAAHVLKKEGFEGATTVADYLTQAARRPWTNAVVVVDEAGLQSNNEGAAVLRHAQKERQRIVFVGDSRQHVAVEAGDFLRVLEEHSKIATCELKNIRRQLLENYREAVMAMSKGHAAAGLEQLDEMGWLKESGADYLKAAAEAYLRRSENGAKADEVVCVAPTWEENFVLSREIRDGLVKAGSLSANSAEIEAVHGLKWTMAQKRALADRLAAGVPQGLTITPTVQIESLEPGRSYSIEGVKDGLVQLRGGGLLDARKKARWFDVGEVRSLSVASGEKLLLRMNDKKRGLINGHVVTVESVAPDGTITTCCGREIPAGYRQLAHGYVLTSHKAQGRTATAVVVAAARLDGKAAYVACSRGRQACDVFTPNKERLFAGVLSDGNRRAALDVIKEERHKARRNLAKPVSVKNRFKQAVAVVVGRVAAFGRRNAALVKRQWEKKMHQNRIRM